MSDTSQLIGELVKTIGAAVAGITGIWNVWWQTRGKHDRFLVGLGTVCPRAYQETFLHVVNLSEHQIVLKDWGFIEKNRKLSSMPLSWETNSIDSDTFVSNGDTQLINRNTFFESGYVMAEKPIGAYAITVTQTRPRLYFETNSSIWTRIYIMLRILMQPNYFDW